MGNSKSFHAILSVRSRNIELVSICRSTDCQMWYYYNQNRNRYKDLPKAIDCSPHGRLIAKLHAYELSEAAFEKMFDYPRIVK